MRISNKNNGFVLMMSVVITLFLSILLGAAMLRTQVQLEESDSRLATQQAFYAAETGVENSLYQIRSNPQWRPGVDGAPVVANVPIQVDNPDGSKNTIGSYSVQVSDDAPDYMSMKSVWVQSVGRDANGVGTRAILARVIIENPVAFFVSTMGNLDIFSGTTVNSDVLGKDVNFHVIKTAANPNIQINGDVLYLNTKKILDDTNPSSVHISGASNKFSSITFPGVDTARYKSLSGGGHYEAGNATFSGVLDRQTMNAPNGLIFAEGDIFISGTVKDNLLFVAGGNIYIQNNLTAEQAIDPIDTPQLGLMAAKDVVISKSAPYDLSIDAFILANGAPGSQKGGTFFADKDPTTPQKGTLNFNGSIAVRGAGVWTAVDLNLYSIRNYTYNLELMQNRKIPFIPSFASIKCWQERVNINDPFPPPDPPQGHACAS